MWAGWGAELTLEVTVLSLLQVMVPPAVMVAELGTKPEAEIERTAWLKLGVF